MSDCEWCGLMLPVVNGVTSTVSLNQEIGPECEATGGPSDYAHCCRPPGHAGDHVYCGLQFHEIERWPK